MGCWHVHALSLRDWIEADALHVGADLLGDFLEHLLSKVASRLALVELHELHDVAGSGHPGHILQTATITI